VTSLTRDHKTFAERVKALRGYLSLTRKQFSKRHGIPEPTIRAWELSLYSISSTHLQKLIKAFRAEDILCTEDWLLHGKGTSPLFALEAINKELEKVHDQLVSPSGPIKPVFLEAAVFEKYNEDSLTFEVADNLMLPLYEKGDYVGGIKPSRTLKDEDFGKPYIIVLDDDTKLVRSLYQGSKNSTFSLGCLDLLNQSKNPVLGEVSPKAIYRIVWYRKKD
jgi:transcriptional regulator with XRE-family HTH domain